MAKRKPKSCLQRRKDDGHSRYWRDRADKLWSQLIQALWHNKCAVCGKTARDCHHIWPRQLVQLRHKTNNGILLCYYHHKRDPKCSPHGGPHGFAIWLIEQCPPMWKAARENVFELYKPSKVDYREICARLQAELDAKAGTGPLMKAADERKG